MTTQTETRATLQNHAGTDLHWRVRGEYLEMPGLRLSLNQAARLWALDCAACGMVLDALVGASFLRRDQDGRYLRSTGGY